MTRTGIARQSVCHLRWSAVFFSSGWSGESTDSASAMIATVPKHLQPRTALSCTVSQTMETAVVEIRRGLWERLKRRVLERHLDGDGQFDFADAIEELFTDRDEPPRAPI